VELGPPALAVEDLPEKLVRLDVAGIRRQDLVQQSLRTRRIQLAQATFRQGQQGINPSWSHGKNLVQQTLGFIQLSLAQAHSSLVEQG
jgi:hypothetical protein